MPSWRASPRSRRAACSARSSSYPATAARLVERMVVLADVVVGAGHRGVREGVGRDEVLAPDLHRVDAQLGRGHVHDAFEHLRSPPAGRRRGRRRGRGRVGGHAEGVHLDLGDLVDPLRHHAGEERRGTRRSPGRRRRRGAPWPRSPMIVPSRREPQLDVLRPGPPVGHRHHVLGAGLGPLHGSVRAPGRARPRSRTRRRRPSWRRSHRPPPGAITRTSSALDAEPRAASESAEAVGALGGHRDGHRRRRRAHHDPVRLHRDGARPAG